MAISNISGADAVAPRLDHLLRRACFVKRSTGIDPPLPVSELVPENEPLLGDMKDEKEVRMLAVESAAKRVFYANLGSTRIEDPAFVTVWNLLDILQYCGDRELCSPQLILLLVEELLDSQSIAECRTVFSFLESRREAIIAVNSKNKDLVILRLCNELLRRLSRAEDPVFCGRVYIFMFQSFPLGDKSSVNLRGNFHVENVTTFEDFLGSTSIDPVAMQIDQDSDASTDKKESISDAKMTDVEEQNKGQEYASNSRDIEALYPVFWSLQHSFSDPPRLFEEDNFKHFQRSLESTLDRFKAVPTVMQSCELERKNGQKARSEDSYETFANTFNPKYLTSRDLFKLELSDLAFQRHILVQALILVDFLLTLTEKSKSKAFYQNAQKAMQYEFTLGEEETEWALRTKNAISNYLQEGPDGKFYYRMVDTVLSRDKNWVRWKMENCQPFTRDRVPTAHVLQAKSGAQKAAANKKAAKPVGAPNTLGFLHNSKAERGLSQLGQQNRFEAPSLDAYAQRVRTADLDMDMANTEEEKRQAEETRSMHVWRGLRLASKKQLSSFDRIEHGKGLEALQPAVGLAVDSSSSSSDGAVDASADQGSISLLQDGR